MANGPRTTTPHAGMGIEASRRTAPRTNRPAAAQDAQMMGAPRGERTSRPAAADKAFPMPAQNDGSFWKGSPQEFYEITGLHALQNHDGQPLTPKNLPKKGGASVHFVPGKAFERWNASRNPFGRQRVTVAPGEYRTWHIAAGDVKQASELNAVDHISGLHLMVEFGKDGMVTVSRQGYIGDPKTKRPPFDLKGKAIPCQSVDPTEVISTKDQMHLLGDAIKANKAGESYGYQAILATMNGTHRLPTSPEQRLDTLRMIGQTNQKIDELPGAKKPGISLKPAEVKPVENSKEAPRAGGAKLAFGTAL